MIIREIRAKGIISKSQIYDYALNAYVGCGHQCAYCYAAFMKRFTGHKEKWGTFVDVKVNAPELLAKEVKKKRPGRVWVSGVCDPYQPLEEKYKLTRRCVEILADSNWPFTVQTKSALVMRDVDIFKRAADCEVGLSVTTADDAIRKIFEPGASSVEKRLEALETLHANGIRTFAMIAPILPGAEGLVAGLRGKVDRVIIDRMNYHYANRLYEKHGLDWANTDDFFSEQGWKLKRGFDAEGTPAQTVF